MVLHAEHGLVPVAEALDGAVIQVRVRDLDLGGQRRRIHGEAMVLRGDLNPPRAKVLHRMIRATMAELELERPGAHRQSENLVTEADPEDRQAAVDDRSGVPN